MIAPFEIAFNANGKGVNLPFVNGANNPGTTDTQNLIIPMLHQYMLGLGKLKPAVKDSPWPEYKGLVEGSGVKPFVVPFNRTVDVIYNNTDGGLHPMHFHGRTFWVIDTSVYTPVSPILRDVVTVPAGSKSEPGWVKIRYTSDNPGIWLMHCHIDWHLAIGFNSVFIEAPDQLVGKYQNIPAANLALCLATKP